MRSNRAYKHQPELDPELSPDRRRSRRHDTSLSVNIRFLPDGTPLQGSATEVGPNGMRLLTSMPLIEACYIHISFENASNNTHCEGRVVWTQQSRDRVYYESGIDIQRWGGGIPGQDPIHSIAEAPRPERHKRGR